MGEEKDCYDGARELRQNSRKWLQVKGVQKFGARPGRFHGKAAGRSLQEHPLAAASWQQMSHVIGTGEE